MESDIVSGQQSAWVLLKKLGEGDAGEVYLVESLLEKQPAILKRPGRSAFASDVIRQTAQITTEGKILKALSATIKMDGDFPAIVPELLDQSPPGTAFSDRLFIIIERAIGFDLALLAKTTHLGTMSGTDSLAESPEEKRFLQTLAERGRAPERVLLYTLNALLGLFEKIHHRPFDVDGVEVHGILWNDVKPEHLYWDPWRARLTVIDWGNGQLLERDGATRDRRFSIEEDFRQWLEAMGRYLEQTAPDLLERLEWPARSGLGGLDWQAIAALQERIWDALQEQLSKLREAREREAALLRRSQEGGADPRSPAKRSKNRPSANPNPLAELVAVHREIIGYGELPDYGGALDLAMQWAARFAANGQMAEVEETCEWIDGLPGSDGEHLRLVARLARIAARADTQGATRGQHDCMVEAVQHALERDWGSALWSLASALRDTPEPDWWYDLIAAVRRQEVGREDGELQPLLVTRRALLTLQTMAGRMEQAGNAVNAGTLTRLQELVRHLREEVVRNWASLDPDPPHANLAYTEIEETLAEIQAFLPEAGQAIQRALERPRAQARRVLEDWENGQFARAAGGLRRVMLWDPDRKRVLRAEQALRSAPDWLEKVQRGPGPGEHYQAFVTEIEFEGRELRNQIGPAGWIDLILEGCRQLRRGAWPPDLFTSLPLLVQEMPWLRRFERVEKLPAAAGEQALGQPGPNGSAPALVFARLNGTARGKLGLECDLQLDSPLDGWTGEARGSSARVFGGLLRDGQGRPFPVAIKLMRMDKVEYALPLFREEVLVLNEMRSVPGVPALLECGFLKLEDGGKLPAEREGRVNPGLAGSLLRIGPNTGQEFVNQAEARAGEGWTPYLAVEQRDPRDNLLVLCDSVVTGGTYRPVAELLQIAIQICEILDEAHRRNIVYRDHKILHYYWIEANRGVYTIDWNVARLHPEGLSAYEKQMDLVQYGARALHHILTGRTAPGALPLGPTRPEEIEQAAKSYQVQWTYDDQRLPEDLRGILERVLAGDYNNAIQLRDDLKEAFLRLPEV
jgi:serine/threonine protein kinase